MLPKRDEQELIRRYLLGQLTEEEEWRQVEERLLSDSAFQDEVAMAEGELIDEYVFAALTAEETAAFERSLPAHSERREQVRLARALRQYALAEQTEAAPATTVTVPDKPPPRRWAWREWFSLPAVRVAALATVLLAVGVSVWRVFIYQSGAEQGLAQLRRAYPQDGPLDVRVTGLDYAPPPPATRGSNTVQPDAIALRLAETKLLEAVQATPGAASAHALGRFYLTQKRYDEAVKQLEAALRLDPDNAQLNADLGAALLAQGLPLYEQDRAQGRPNPSVQPKQLWLELFSRSLTHLARALELDANLLPARFNRALCLQSMTLANQARAAWQDYLARDANSPWAERARAYLKQLDDAQAAAQTPAQILAGFLDAHRQGDDARAWQILSQTREMITGQMVVLQLARKFLAASTGNQPDEARHYLDAFTYAGELEKTHGGDPYVSDLARYYSETEIEQRNILFDAHKEFSAGLQLCLETKYGEALARFTQAKKQFSLATDEYEANVLNLWQAHCHYQNADIAATTAAINLLERFSQANDYKWLHAQSLIRLAYCQVSQGNRSQGLSTNIEVLRIAEEVGDACLISKVLDELALQNILLGRLDRALAYQQRALQITSNAFPFPRLIWRNLNNTIETLHTLRLYDAAIALGQEILSLNLPDPALTYLTHVHLAASYKVKGDTKQALAEVNLALQTAQTIKSVSMQQKAMAYTLLQSGTVKRQSGNCQDALLDYENAISLYDRQVKYEVDKYVAHKGRLLCYLTEQRDEAAQAEIEYLLQLFEEYRAQILEEKNRNSFFDNEQGIYDLAIDYEHKHGNYRQAFAYSEKSRARSLSDALHGNASVSEQDGEKDILLTSMSAPKSIETLQRTLPAKLSVIQYAVLQDKLVIWVISSNRFETAESSINKDDLEAKVNSYLKLITTERWNAPSDDLGRQSAELYALLINPVANWLAESQTLCIIPDKALFTLPFASLRSSDKAKYLIAQFSLIFAPSANVFALCSAKTRQLATPSGAALLSVGNPAFDRRAYPDLPDLPTATTEAQKVASYYRQSEQLIGRQATKPAFMSRLAQANVVHFAGHYVLNEADSIDSKMLLACADNNNGSDCDLSVSDLLGKKLEHTELIVLSACHTSSGKYYQGEGMIGIARSFLATGVPQVVASQWAVDSNATGVLMVKFHHYLSRGLTMPEALQQAQIDLINSNETQFNAPYFWAAFLPLGGYANN